MALISLTLRQNLHRYLAGIPLAIFPRSSSSSSPLISHGSIPSVQSSTSPPQQQWWSHFLQSRSFKSSPVSQWSSRSISNSKDNEIGPDTILFEGCDYNHWLIVMDFPKDNKPPPEEMIRTYEETCAKGLGISVEEAKKKMYACSTTTYTGFQAVMTEEESEKFNGLPGVIFVLPDSYIDPQNKEYGGDKYIDGTIIPRPPPVQHGRQAGRFRDRNRFPDQPRYDRQGAQVPNQQGNPNYGQQQGRMQEGGRNYGPPQTYASPQQNYSPPAQNYASPGQNYASPGQNYASPGQNYGPPGQNYGPPQQQNYGPPGQNYGPPQQQNYAPPGQNYASSRQQNYTAPGQMERRDSMPMNSGGGRDFYQSGRGGPMPPYQGDHNQGGQGYFPQGDQRSNAHNLQGGFIGDNRNFGPAQGSPYGQGAGGYSGQATPEPGQGQNWTNRA